jgi:hypothetical protein
MVEHATGHGACRVCPATGARNRLKLRLLSLEGEVLPAMGDTPNTDEFFENNSSTEDLYRFAQKLEREVNRLKQKVLQLNADVARAEAEGSQP